MCKFILFHHEETDHPISAFALGICVSCVNVFTESANMLYAMSTNDVSSVLGKFVAFKILI